MKTFTAILLAGISVIAGFHPSFAQTDTIFASYTYTMGDNDTKSDARQKCLLYAKRECLEKAGTFVHSELSIRKEERMDGSESIYFEELTKQELSTFTGAFVKVDIVSEQFAYSGETMALTIKVKAIVNVDSIQDQILALRQDKELQQQVKGQQEKLLAMEGQFVEIENKLTEMNDRPTPQDWLNWYNSLTFSKYSTLFEYEMEDRVKIWPSDMNGRLHWLQTKSELHGIANSHGVIFWIIPGQAFGTMSPGKSDVNWLWDHKQKGKRLIAVLD